MILCALCGAKNYHLSFINYHLTNHEQRHLEQDPEHRDHRADRHSHHLRGDIVHGRVIRHKKITTLLTGHGDFMF